MSSTTTFIDLESGSRINSGTHLPIAPQPAHTSSSNLALNPNPTTNAIDDFFGARPTHESRHDLRHLSTGDVPPPYPEADLPAYTVEPDEEPATLAMYLFKFGFIFPPFWILGTFVLLSSLSAPSDWHPTKPEEDRQHLVKVMRKAEVKWAKRCLFALMALIIFVTLVGLGCWMVSKH